MRPSLRAVGLLALVAAAITCTDAPTAPRGSDGPRAMARIGLSPSFSAEAARAYRGLLDFGFDVASVRVRLMAADGTLAKDTVIAFPSAQDTLRVDLSIQMQGSEQTFTALIELRDASGAVLFTGARLVTARTGGLPGASPPTIALEYAGPGRDARSIAVSPGDGPRFTSDVVSLTASGVDSAGRPVSDLLVRWTSSDSALGALTATGRATAELRAAGKRGAVVLTALTPNGLAASTRLALVPPPARLVVVGGDAQSGIAGRPLPQPFVVELQAADGGPVPNTVVVFRAVSAGGAAAAATVNTDSAGRATSAITLGKTPGPYVFAATSGAVAPVSITASATGAPVVAIAIVSGDAQRDSVGSPLAQPLVVRVLDDLDAPVAGAAVDWTSLAGTGTLSATRSFTDTNGLAGVSYTLGNARGTESVRASVSAASGAATSVVFTARSISRAPASIRIVSGGGQQGVAGTTLSNPLIAFVSDALGNAVSGAVVSWSTQAGSPATLTPKQTITDADGLARAMVTLSAKAGLLTVVARVGSLGSAAQLGAVAGIASTFQILQALPSTVLVGVPPANSLRIQLADAAGNAARLPGVAVTATIVLARGGPPRAPVSATSDSVGVATFNLPAYVGAADSATIIIGAPGFTSLTTPAITFAVGPISLLDIATQPSSSATSGSPFAVQPVVRLQDAGGNQVAVAGVKITAYVASGGGVLGGTVTVDTDANGVATFTDLSITASAGQKTLGFMSPSLPDVLSAQIALQ